MSFVVIIPARFASTRLPGKPLQDINGKPMIVHVLERARESGADRIIVATDHEDVARAVEAAGGEVCMTRADHQSGTEPGWRKWWKSVRSAMTPLSSIFRAMSR